MREGNDIQENRPSYKCLFSIDLGDPGRIVDGAPYRPSLVPARLAVARWATAVVQVGAVCSDKRFFLCRRHCCFWLRFNSRGEILRNDQGAGEEQVKVERAGSGHGWKRLWHNWVAVDSTQLHLPPIQTHVINRVLRQAQAQAPLCIDEAQVGSKPRYWARVACPLQLTHKEVGQ